MKNKRVIAVGVLLLSNQLIINQFFLSKKIKEDITLNYVEEIKSIEYDNFKTGDTITDIFFVYRKKDFTHIENQLAIFKFELQNHNPTNKFLSELGKNTAQLSGNILLGANKRK